MASAVDQFRTNLRRVRDLSHTIHAIEGMTTRVIDLSDLLRTQLVLAVSALDHFVHEHVRTGMLEIHAGRRAPTDAYLRYQVPLGVTRPPMDITETDWLDDLIRENHSWRSFQHPDNIAEAIRLIYSEPLWRKVADHLTRDDRAVKTTLKVIVDRRNKIAHEADMDPTNPGALWPIDAIMVGETIDFIEAVGEAIHRVTT